jgi:hypothetical protein
MVSESGIPESEFVKAIDRVRAGEKPVDVLDDRFVDAFSIAGNADDCLAAIGHYGEIGVTELILTFIGTQPTVDMAYLGESLAKRA